MSMTDLIEFLRARLDDDEVRADCAGGNTWERDCRCGDVCREGHDCRRITGPDIEIYDEGGHSLDQAMHIVRWDPKRVLAEVDAKRRIIDLHSSRISIWWPDQEACEVEVCKVCSESEYSPDGDVEAPCPTIRLLALPYADHPDFREEWRP